jgi:5-enolpyruvylshikimate-3-phosphate synthase
VFETEGDHRLAMSMAILASRLHQKFSNVHFVIDDKNAVNKTFPEFWKYLREVGVIASYKFTDREINNVK